MIFKNISVDYMKRRVLWLASLVFAVNAGVDVSSSSKFLGSFRVGPMYRNLGRSYAQLNNTEMVLFDNMASERYCKPHTDILFENMVEEFGGRIILINISLASFHSCFPEFPNHYKTFDLFSKWCSLNSSLIILNKRKTDFQFNRYGTREHEFPHCGIYSAVANDVVSKLDSISKFMVNLTTDEPQCEAVFSSIYVLIFSRIFISCLFMLTGIYALVALICIHSNQWIGRIVLCVNALLCIYISVVWLLGSHYITPTLSQQLQTTNMALFFTSNSAVDILLSLRWLSFNNEVTKKLPSSSDFQLLSTKKPVVIFSIFLFFWDWVYSYLFINMSSDTELLVTSGIPAVLILLELSIFAYFFKQILFMNNYLQSMKVDLCTAAILLKQSSQRDHAAALRHVAVKLHKWLLLASGSVFAYAVFTLLLQPTGAMFQSCEAWVCCWSFFALLRVASAFSQVKLCICRTNMTIRKVLPNTPNAEHATVIHRSST